MPAASDAQRDGPRRRGGARRALAVALGVVAGGLVPLAPTGAANGAQVAPRLVEGDILVGPRARFRGVGSSSAGRRWPHGVVPYVLDDSLGGDGALAVAEATARWNAVSGITLVHHADPGSAPRDHLVFQNGPGCASWVGRQGGAQEVWVGPSCSSGSVMHEIGHALGLEHEHTRHDRDAHVRVLWERIVPEKRHNFEPAPPDARLLGDYDLESIMHYGPDNFSIDGRPTLEPLDPLAGARMGQREGPSAGDVAAIARLYGSDLALETRVDDPLAVREVTLHVTNEHPQGAHDVVVAVAAAGLRASAQSDGDWRCQSAADGARCTLERLAGDAASQVTLALASPLEATRLRAGVTSKTPDVDPANNGETALDRPALGAARTLPGGKTADARALASPNATNPFGDASGEAFSSPVADDGSGSGGGAAGALVALGAAFALRRRRSAHCASG